MIKPHKSIVTQFILIIILTLLITVFFTGFFIINHYLKIEIKNASDKNINMANNLSLLIDAKLDSFIQKINILSSVSAFSEYNNKDITLILRREYSKKLFLPDERIFILDQNNRVISDNSISVPFEFDAGSLNFDASKLNFYETYVSEVDYNQIIPKIYIAMAVYSEKKEKNTVIAEFSLRNISEAVSGQLISDNTMIIITDINGNIIADSKKYYANKKMTLKDLGFSENLIIKFADKMQKEITFNNTSYIVTFSPSSQNRFGVFIFEKKKMLFETVKNNILNIFVIMILSLFITTFISLFVYFKLIKPVNTLSSEILNNNEKQIIEDFNKKKESSKQNEIGILYSGFIYKMSQIEKRENEKNMLISELKEMDKMKDEFLANTSHELRTPLNGIIGIADSLLAGIKGPLPDLVSKDLYLVISSARRLNNLVNDILDFSKLKNKEIKLFKTDIDLYSAVSVVLAVLKPLLGNKKIEIINGVSKKFPAIEADEIRLEQIFYNLVGNAVKFTEAGRIEIRAEAKTDTAEICISDTGIGIPADKIESIFNSFEQLDGTVSRKYGGTGLGLAITKKLIEAHGGIIRVESDHGKGSKFIFTVPLSKKSENKKYQKESAIIYNYAENSLTGYTFENQDELKADDKKFNILIVDDEPINLQVLDNYIRLYIKNANVHKVQKGEEALRLVKSFDNRIDMVLLDIMMPGMSGFEVCEEIRKIYDLNTLPIIIITAKNQLNALLQGLTLGANDYITKPFIKEELTARIKNLIGLKEKTDELIKTRLIGLHALAELTELKDFSTGNHIKRVAEYTKLIAVKLSKIPDEYFSKYLTKTYIEDLSESSVLHDIGKVGIPDRILLKNGKLNKEEFEEIKKHTTIGGDALEKIIREMKIKYFELGREVAYFHHEKFDGTGYPMGLIGNNIPLSARIVSIADVYDALTGDRPYRKAMSHEEACRIINEEMGSSHFDPLILDIFNKISDQFREVNKKYSG